MNIDALRRIALRLVMMIGGEAMQSAFHLGLNLALLHSVSARDYGIFALVMVVGGLGLTYIRSLTALPASICVAQSRSAYAADAYEVTFGSAAVLVSGVTAIMVAAVLEVWLDEGAVVGGAFVGLWALRSHLRTVLIARGRQKLVSMSDALFTLSGTAVASVVLHQDQHVLQYTFAALAFANALGIGVLLGLRRGPVRISLSSHVWRRYARIWHDLKWSLLSVTVTNLQGQSVALLVAAFAGPAAYAPLAAALVMFVPLRIISTAFAGMMHPELSALIAKGEFQKVKRLMWNWPFVLAGFSIAYGSVVLLALPYIRPETLEDVPFYKISILAWIAYAIPMLYVIPRVMMEIMSDYRAIAILSAVAATIGTAVVVAILLTLPSSWSLAGGVVSELIVLGGSWLIVLRQQARLAHNGTLSVPPDRRRPLPKRG